MISTQLLLQIAILTLAIFLLNGGLAFLNMLINGAPSNEPYPKLLSLTPIAMFLTSLGAMGIFMVILCSKNANDNGGLARKQFYAGFSLLFICYVGLELLLYFGLH